MRGKASLIGLAAVLVLAAPASAATTYNVTNTTDASGTCSTNCTLRQAVNSVQGGSGGDTISIAAGTYPLTLGTLGPITKQVTIAGAGARSTIIDAAGAGVALNFNSGSS